MNKLSIFWFDKMTEHFYWTVDINQKNIVDETSVIPALQQQKILKADLACLADMAQGKKVELIISDQDVHFAQIALPNKAQRHIRKAIPYLLEEQLAEAVDDTFVAIGQRMKNGDIPVRAIKLVYFESLLKQFKQAEIRLDQVRVDLDLLAQPEAGYCLVLHQHQVLISEKNANNWSCHQDDFGWLIQKHISADNKKKALLEPESNDDDTLEALDESDMPVAIPLTIVCQTEDEYRMFEKQLPVGLFAPQAQICESVEEYLSKTNQVTFNLLQAEYEVKVENSPVKKLLTKLASLAAIILVVFVIFQISQIISLEAQKSQLAKQRTALWKQAFPGRRVPSNPDKALRSHLTSLGGGEGDSSFLSLLESSSQKIDDIQAIYPTNISYDAARNELRMDLVAKDLPTLNKYRDALKESGHEVDMSSATQRGEGYSSRLIIRK